MGAGVDWTGNDVVQLRDKPGQPDATIKMLASDLGKTNNGKNDRSIVMSLRIGARKKMLFLGDLDTEPAYNNLLYPTNGAPPSKNHPHPKNYVDEIRNHQIVMVPHHGSGTCGNPNARLYNEVNPTYAIVSSSIMRAYNFPKVETLQAICRGHTVAVDTNYDVLSGPIGWTTYNSKSSDCSDSDSTDPDIMATPLNPKYKSMLQTLQNCDVHIYQTSKPLVNYENGQKGFQLFEIVTRISATNTIVTANRYSGDV